MRMTISFFSILFVIGSPLIAQKNINNLADRYVRLGLAIGVYDEDFVDAYYGPDSLKPDFIKNSSFPKDSLLSETQKLQSDLQKFKSDGGDAAVRAKWMQQQLIAFQRRIRIFSGEFDSFDKESKELFGLIAPTYPESYFKSVIQQLDSLLPGNEPVAVKFQNAANRFVIPSNKIDTVFMIAIEEARKRTLINFDLPASESFNLEYVTGKSWSGYNWYKGNFKSLIQISVDLPIFPERAIDLACHEGYPGHHVYNAMLEENLYRKKGWVEISLYPLFSPQSFIAEGSANFGIRVAFPGIEQLYFTRDILLPAAGVDTSGYHLYYKALELRGKLNYARNEVARGLINGTMTEPVARQWLMDYSLFSPEAAEKSLRFIKKYRSYVINYNYGQDVIKQYIESRGGTSGSQKRWDLFKFLLSNPVTTEELIKPY